MRRVVKGLGYLLILGLIVAGGGLYWATSAPTLDPIDPAELSFTDDEIERGELLALVGDCSACHTAPGGQDYAGGLGLPTPFGTIYSTNITPDVETGIGTWSFDAFERAMRQGLDREGGHLYPAFPYDFFNKTRDEDLRALYAYFMSQEPVSVIAKENELPFPFSFRPSLAGWKLLFLDQSPFEPDPALDDEQNHGAYLAESLGHCGACHSPRNAFGAVIADRALEGGEAEGWIAPAIGPHSTAPIVWTLDDYADYLFDGWSEAHGIAGGPMTSVADHLYDADEDDVFAMAAWLDALSLEQTEDDRERILAEIGSLDWPAIEGQVYDEEVPDELVAGRDVFLTRCAKCHKERISRNQPISLGLSSSIRAETPQNLFNIIRGGIAPPYGVVDRKMEAILMSAEDMAAVAAYVRWHFSDEPAWDQLTELAENAEATAH